MDQALLSIVIVVDGLAALIGVALLQNAAAAVDGVTAAIFEHLFEAAARLFLEGEKEHPWRRAGGCALLQDVAASVR